MTLNIKYDENEYQSINDRLINEKRKAQKKYLNFGTLVLILGIIELIRVFSTYSLGANLVVGLTAIIIGASLIITGKIIIIYSVSPDEQYENTLFELVNYKFWLNTEEKRANDIFAKVDNGDVLIYYRDAYNPGKYIPLQKFFDRLGCEYKNEIPENFDTMNIIAKDGKVNISFS